MGAPFVVPNARATSQPGAGRRAKLPPFRGNEHNLAQMSGEHPAGIRNGQNIAGDPDATIKFQKQQRGLISQQILQRSTAPGLR